VAISEAKEAPDKRLQAGAVPAATTNRAVLLVRNGNPACALCMSGHPPTKMKRQYIHNIKGRNFVCPVEDKPPMSEGSKRRG
jgi:hypothetical protein